MSLSLDGKCDQEQRVFRHSGVTGREIGVMMSRTPLFCRTLARSTTLWGRTGNENRNRFIPKEWSLRSEREREVIKVFPYITFR